VCVESKADNFQVESYQESEKELKSTLSSLQDNFVRVKQDAQQQVVGLTNRSDLMLYTAIVQARMSEERIVLTQQVCMCVHACVSGMECVHALYFISIISLDGDRQRRVRMFEGSPVRGDACSAQKDNYSRVGE